MTINVAPWLTGSAKQLYGFMANFLETSLLAIFIADSAGSKSAVASSLEHAKSAHESMMPLLLIKFAGFPGGVMCWYHYLEVAGKVILLHQDLLDQVFDEMPCPIETLSYLVTIPEDLPDYTLVFSEPWTTP